MASTPATRRQSLKLSGLFLVLSRGLALAQLLLLLPSVSNGRALDFPPYRVDSLNLALGVTWTVAAALASVAPFRTETPGLWHGWSTLVASLCMLNVVYARELWWLYLWLEIGAVGLWLASRRATRNAWQAPPPVVYLPGLPLLLIILLGQAKDLVPPAGGVTQPWALLAVVALASTVLLRCGSWVYLTSRRTHSEPKGEALVGLYVLFVPVLLAKALVAAPWDAVGIWTIVLLGTAGLSGAIAVMVALPRLAHTVIAASALAAAAIIGFGLSPASPLAAAGALAILLSGSLWISAAPFDGRRLHQRPAFLLGGFVGVWLISQSALNTGYGIVAALLLPGMLALVLVPSRERSDANDGRNEPVPATTKLAVASVGLLVLILAIVAIYPQAAAQMVLRPAVQAMAGGVGALSSLRVDAGVGLSVLAPQGTIVAALPATGVAVAVLFSFVALYWLRKLLTRLVRVRSDASSE